MPIGYGYRLLPEINGDFAIFRRGEFQLTINSLIWGYMEKRWCEMHMQISGPIHKIMPSTA